MSDIMVDLETMGQNSNAPIVAIGAVKFDIREKQIIDHFYKVVDLESALFHGAKLDAGTVYWWLKQSDEARMALVKDQIHIADALVQFEEFIGAGGKKSTKIWGNGASFDNAILASAYRNLNMELPWEYWNDRCYRTLKAQNPGVKVARSGVHHNALDDATTQTVHLFDILRSIGQ